MSQQKQILKVLRMEHAIAENDRTTRETLLQNWRASQRPYGEKIQTLGVFGRNWSDGPDSYGFPRDFLGPLAPISLRLGSMYLELTRKVYFCL